jgi:cytochrome P450
MFKWGNMSVGQEDPEYQVESGSPLETQQEGVKGIGGYVTKFALERRGGDGEDLLSVLGNARIGERYLTEGELFHNGWLYTLGGLETTRNAISGGLLALIQHPTERARLANDATLMPSAIEEILRWTSPITHIARTATRNTEVGGQKIREGERLALWLPSANRDEAIFHDSYSFDLQRNPNEHIAFGRGAHASTFHAGPHRAQG